MSGDTLVATPFTFVQLRKPRIAVWHLKKHEIKQFFNQKAGNLTQEELKKLYSKGSDLLLTKDPCLQGMGQQNWIINGKMYFQGLLNTIFEPFVWEEHGNIVNREVSAKKFRRANIDCCRTKFDKFVQWKQMPNIGICPVRHTFHFDFFDEVIRQTTIQEPVQGILLKRVRDEMQMTIDHLKCMYDYLPVARFEGFEKLLEEYKEPSYMKAQEENEARMLSLEAEIEELRQKRVRCQSELSRMLSCNDTELDYAMAHCARSKKFANDITDRYKAQLTFLHNTDLSLKDLEEIIHPKDLDEQEIVQLRLRRHSSEVEDADEIEEMLKLFDSNVEKIARSASANRPV